MASSHYKMIWGFTILGGTLLGSLLSGNPTVRGSILGFPIFVSTLKKDCSCRSGLVARAHFAIAIQAATSRDGGAACAKARKVLFWSWGGGGGGGVKAYGL